MQFRQLEYFVTLAREGHFARAAKACFVSQPALSESIHKLEKELGVPLVKRRQNYQGLTPEGDRVLVWAQRILKDHSSLGEEIEAMRSGLSGTLKIGVIPAASSTISLLVDPFRSKHPRVKINLESSLRSSEIIQRIGAFELDAGVIYLDEYDDADLSVLPLYTERHVLVAHEDLLGHVRDEEFGWDDVVDYPLCLINRGMRGRQLVDEALSSRGLVADPGVETDSLASLFALVRTGRWTSVVAQQWLLGFDLPPEIRVIPLEQLVHPRVGLVAHGVTPGSVLVEALFAQTRPDRLEKRLRLGLAGGSFPG